jgi:hypothetical protein
MIIYIFITYSWRELLVCMQFQKFQSLDLRTLAVSARIPKHVKEKRLLSQKKQIFVL